MVQLDSGMLWVLHCSTVRASLASIWNTASRAAAVKFHFSFMLNLILITVWFNTLNVDLFLRWHVLQRYSRNHGLNKWTPAKHSSVCLHSSSSVIFLQRVLFPPPHKSLSGALLVCTQARVNLKQGYFSVLREHCGAKRETWNHYASLTPEIKDRKQAGGQCVTLEQRYLSVGKRWDKIFMSHA